MPRDVAMPEPKRYGTFAEFYPFYLAEHGDRTTRRLHFLGLSLALVCLVLLIATHDLIWLLLVFVCGYGFAWIGHFFFAKNQPASFKQPLYSFMADWRMFWEMLTGRIPL
jgi:hypothetical protein